MLHHTRILQYNFSKLQQLASPLLIGVDMSKGRPPIAYMNLCLFIQPCLFVSVFFTIHSSVAFIAISLAMRGPHIFCYGVCFSAKKTAENSPLAEYWLENINVLSTLQAHVIKLLCACTLKQVYTF